MIGRQMEELVNLDIILRSLKEHCHGNQLKSQNWRFSQTNLLCRSAIPKPIAISQFRFQKIIWHEFLCIVYNFGEIWFSSPRVYAVNNNTFLAIRQKSSCHAKYLRISCTYLELLYGFGRRIGVG